MGRGPTVEYHKNMMDGYIQGTLTCLAADYMKNNINTDFPLVINIEPTNACNLNCYLCPRSTGVRKVGYMDFGLFKNIIDECKSYKRLKMINFHKDGESLLHPKIFEMIRYADEANVADVLHINTNGLPLEEKDFETFLLSGIDDVTISIDATREKTFEKIKNANLLGKVEANVRRLLALKKELGLTKPFIRVKIMEFEDVSQEEIREFQDKWEGIADDVQVTGVHSWSGAINNLKITDEVKQVRYPCVLLWYMTAVNWDGSVSACNVDWNLSTLIGDLNKETMHSVWNGRKLRDLRKAELSGNHESAQVCQKCVVWASGENMTDWLRSKREFYT